MIGYMYSKIKKRFKIQKLAFTFFVLATTCISIAAGSAILGSYYSRTSGLLLITIISSITIWLHVKSHIKTIGIFVAPFSMLILLFLAFSYNSTGIHISPKGPHYLAKIHITLSVLGQSFAIVGFAIATLYLFQQRALKKKQLNFISKATPPLNKLESSLILSLWCGFGFLSLGLISGVVFTIFLSELSISLMYTKIIWALAVWIWYLAILLTKNVFGKSGSVIAKMSCLGFTLLMITFFGLAEMGEALG